MLQTAMADGRNYIDILCMQYVNSCVAWGKSQVNYSGIIFTSDTIISKGY